MRVIQLLTSTDATKVVEAHNAFYGTDKDAKPLPLEYYQKAIALMKTKVLIETGMVVTVDHLVTRHDDPVDDTDDVYVGARIDGEDYSMSFIPWGEVLAAEYECGFDISDAEIAAHIFWELTWHGMEMEMEERRDELTDRIDELDRDLAKLEEGEELPHTYKNIDDVWSSLFPNETEDDKARRRVELDRRVANYRTAKTYKNGILVEKETDNGA